MGVLTLNPFPCVTSSFPAPGAQQPGLAQRGQAGEVGGSFQLHLCLGKIPFHVAACDLSRRLCRRGRPAGRRRRRCSRAPSPPTQGKLQHLRTSSGWRESSEVWGWEAWPAGGTQAGGSCLPPPSCWQHKSRRWPGPALRCGVDGSGASPKGGVL